MLRNLRADPTVVDFYDGYLFAYLRHRIDGGGDAVRNRLGSFYAGRIAGHQHIILGHEKQLLANLLTLAWPGRIWDIGAGLGTMAALLAINGIAITGLENSHDRFVEATALREDLAILWPQAQAPDGFAEASYPDDLDRLQPPPSTADLLLFTNFVNTYSEKAQPEILATFPRFGAIIVELRMFGRRRETPEEREALSEEICAQGFRAAPLGSQEAGDHYRLFLPAG